MTRTDAMFELRTARLLRRVPSEADFPSYREFYRDAEASAFYGGPLAPHEAWRRLAADVGHWTLKGHGVWAIEFVGATNEAERADPSEATSGLEGPGCVGICGLDRNEGWPRHELTWWIARSARRRGIAEEASRAVIAWAFANGWGSVETHMRDDNAAARNLVKKLGGTPIARERFPDGVVRDVFAFPSTTPRSRTA